MKTAIELSREAGFDIDWNGSLRLKDTRPITINEAGDTVVDGLKRLIELVREEHNEQIPISS